MKKLKKKWLILGVGGSALIMVLILIAAAYSRFSTLAEKYLAKQPPAEARVTQIYPNVEKFTLPPCTEDGECEEVPTFDAGPGTKHRLRGDAPYRAISVQSDGKRIIYDMPSGWETWTGAAPAGKLRLANAKGAKEKTLVEIIRVQ